VEGIKVSLYANKESSSSSSLGNNVLKMSCKGGIAFYVHPLFVNYLDNFKIIVDFTPFLSLKY
jgi:hypothetical protein